jgi:lambda repressor-like predicted transcriptional regulator
MTASKPMSRMSPDEFKAEVKRRGWTYRALAARWEVSENWVSKLARDETRSTHWDDAVRGLPQLVKK